MPTSDSAKLRIAAEDMLRSNDGNVKRAAPKLARTLIENAPAAGRAGGGLFDALAAS
jgi:hypothetical protein